jgi:twitching motility protein PilI
LSFNSGLLVSRVLGLRNTAEMQADAADQNDAPWSGKRYVDRESQTWTELDLASVVQDPQFLHVGL